MRVSRTASKRPDHPATRVVLVGAGHAHLHLLRSWATNPPANASLTVITDEEDSVYSGMVPGFLAGDYRWQDMAIPVGPLVRRANAKFVLQRAVRIDPERKVVRLENGQEVSYDTCSLDVGSTVRGLEVPGVREHALATRPIGGFARRIDACVATARARQDRSIRVVVVGGGAAGVELAFCLQHRLAGNGLQPNVVVACGSGGLLPGYHERVRRTVLQHGLARGVSLQATPDVVSVSQTKVHFKTGECPTDLIVWATGAAPPLLIAESPLPRDAKGFVSVEPTFRVRGTDGLFAAGDCASIRDHPSLAKAGVHAVRSGPVLDFNVRAFLRGAELREFRPQSHFLSLLNLGNRRALATKWGLVGSGKAAWTVKDRIDRSFVRQYRASGEEPR